MANSGCFGCVDLTKSGLWLSPCSCTFSLFINGKMCFCCLLEKNLLFDYPVFLVPFRSLVMKCVFADWEKNGALIIPK